MSYSILRIAKIKSMQELENLAREHDGRMLLKHADPSVVSRKFLQ